MASLPPEGVGHTPTVRVSCSYRSKPNEEAQLIISEDRVARRPARSWLKTPEDVP